MGALGGIPCCFEHRRASQVCNLDTDDDSAMILGFGLIPAS